MLSGLVQLVEIQGKACCAETDDENKKVLSCHGWRGMIVVVSSVLSSFCFLDDREVGGLSEDVDDSRGNNCGESDQAKNGG